MRFHSVVDLVRDRSQRSTANSSKRKVAAHSTRSAFSRKSLESPAMSGSATELSTVGASDLSMSRARNVESRSSSSLMTTAIKRSRDATTRSLKRLLKHEAEANSRERKSKAMGLRVAREGLVSLLEQRGDAWSSPEIQNRVLTLDDDAGEDLEEQHGRRVVRQLHPRGRDADLWRIRNGS